MKFSELLDGNRRDVPISKIPNYIQSGQPLGRTNIYDLPTVKLNVREKNELNNTKHLTTLQHFTADLGTKFIERTPIDVPQATKLPPTKEMQDYVDMFIKDEQNVATDPHIRGEFPDNFRKITKVENDYAKQLIENDKTMVTHTDPHGYKKGKYIPEEFVRSNNKRLNRPDKYGPNLTRDEIQTHQEPEKVRINHREKSRVLSNISMAGIYLNDPQFVALNTSRTNITRYDEKAEEKEILQVGGKVKDPTKSVLLAPRTIKSAKKSKTIKEQVKDVISNLVKPDYSTLKAKTSKSIKEQVKDVISNVIKPDSSLLKTKTITPRIMIGHSGASPTAQRRHSVRNDVTTAGQKIVSRSNDNPTNITRFNQQSGVSSANQYVIGSRPDTLLNYNKPMKYVPDHTMKSIVIDRPQSVL